MITDFNLVLMDLSYRGNNEDVVSSANGCITMTTQILGEAIRNWSAEGYARALTPVAERKSTRYYLRSQIALQPQCIG